MQWGQSRADRSRGNIAREQERPTASDRRPSERARLRWRDEHSRARGVVLGRAVPVLRGRAGGAAPPLLRASRRGVARLPRARRLRGARAVAGARRRHRAGAPRAAPPGPLAPRRRRHPTQAAHGPPRLLLTFRSAVEK